MKSKLPPSSSGLSSWAAADLIRKQADNIIGRRRQPICEPRRCSSQDKSKAPISFPAVFQSLDHGTVHSTDLPEPALCGGCGKDTWDPQSALEYDTIQCSRCETWYHRKKKCCGLTKKQWDHFSGPDVEWFCGRDSCLPIATPVPTDTRSTSPEMMPDPSATPVPLENVDNLSNSFILNTPLSPPSTPLPSCLVGSHTHADLVALRSGESDLFSVHFNMNGLGVTEKFVLFLSFLTTAHPDVVFLSETKYPEGGVPKLVTAALFNIGYRSVWQGRTEGGEHGGGVAILMKRDVFTIKARIKTDSEKLENIVVSTESRFGVVVLSAVYNPHAKAGICDIELFLEQVSRKANQHHIIVGGDFNLDLRSHPVQLALRESMFTAARLILGLPDCQPTHLCNTKASCIDHLWVSDSFLLGASGTLDKFSDHLGIFCCLKKTASKASSPIDPAAPIRARKLRSINDDAFTTDLANADWPKPNEEDTPDTYFQRIVEIFTKILDKHAPEVVIKRRRKSNSGLPPPPRKLAALACRRNKLLRQKRSGPWTEADQKSLDELDRMHRCESRNFIHGHYKQRVSKAAGNSKKVWEILKDFLPDSSSQALVSNIVPIPADALNHAFATVGEKIAAETEFPNFDRPAAPPNWSFRFRAITDSDVVKASERMDNKLTTGPDQVPNRLLKLAVPAMRNCLAALFNLSIQKGTLPNIWLNSIVTPIYKAGDHTIPTNYRPISITSCVLKLLERCISDQLKQHLRNTRFLRPNQFGFRAGHNCESCLLKIVHDCKKALDQQECVGLVCIDLSKAFDSLPVSGILSALASAGLDPSALAWFRSYLHGRKQQVKIQNTLSTLEPVAYGVPQGSILGPLLFVIFINELPALCKSSEPSLFADDTTIVASGKTPEDVKLKLEADLQLLNQWLHSNCLKANKDKTDFLFLSNNTAHKPPVIRFGEVDLKASESVKILGFHLDSKLSMAKQVDSVVKKAKSGTYAIRQAGKFLDIETKKMMYDAIVGSHFNYCDGVIGQGDKTQLDRLQVAQNKATRAIYNAHPMASADPLRIRLKWLDLEGKRRVHMATTVWKCLHGSDAPEALSTLLKPVKSVHSHGTRSATSNKLWKGNVNTTKATKSFHFRAPTWWNSLPKAARMAPSATDCRNITYLHHFKIAKKEYKSSVLDLGKPPDRVALSLCI